MTKNLLLIFTRNPELGKVKTRLAASVGNKPALQIYKFLLNHTVSITKTIKATKQVYYSDIIGRKDIWDDKNYDKKLQIGADLGERMQNAFTEGFKNGFKNIVIIGSDIFDLGSEDIEIAFSKLKSNQIVIGPAQDGGYYLLGMKEMHPFIFKNKKWGSNTVLGETLKDLSGSSVYQLSVRNDVDVFEDIKDNKVFQRFL